MFFLRRERYYLLQRYIQTLSYMHENLLKARYK